MGGEGKRRGSNGKSSGSQVQGGAIEVEWPSGPGRQLAALIGALSSPKLSARQVPRQTSIERAMRGGTLARLVSGSLTRADGTQDGWEGYEGPKRAAQERKTRRPTPH